jgi:hypothetical protein
MTKTGTIIITVTTIATTTLQIANTTPTNSMLMIHVLSTMVLISRMNALISTMVLTSILRDPILVIMVEIIIIKTIIILIEKSKL